MPPSAMRASVGGVAAHTQPQAAPFAGTCSMPMSPQSRWRPQMMRQMTMPMPMSTATRLPIVQVTGGSHTVPQMVVPSSSNGLSSNGLAPPPSPHSQSGVLSPCHSVQPMPMP
eukprot:NODE_25562_length_583_cov_1.208333.p1 GENE.NODE_25562_length_583_cov_1.208333~~NODE_25562_length_583_cov_1.208333.p1  ORF type:complete len:113 (-),score=24.66 NODE_25562_length_583_cov_1.208333:244-582(-)